MASLSNIKGRFTIQFRVGKHRRTIRLGQVTRGSALVTKSHVEHLVLGLINPFDVPANTVHWTNLLGEPYRDRPGSPLTAEFLPGRIRFIRADKKAIGPNERPPFGCCLLIWSRPILPVHHETPALVREEGEHHVHRND